MIIAAPCTMRASHSSSDSWKMYDAAAMLNSANTMDTMVLQHYTNKRLLSNNSIITNPEQPRHQRSMRRMVSDFTTTRTRMNDSSRSILLESATETNKTVPIVESRREHRRQHLSFPNCLYYYLHNNSSSLRGLRHSPALIELLRLLRFKKLVEASISLIFLLLMVHHHPYHQQPRCCCHAWLAAPVSIHRSHNQRSHQSQNFGKDRTNANTGRAGGSQYSRRSIVVSDQLMNRPTSGTSSDWEPTITMTKMTLDDSADSRSSREFSNTNGLVEKDNDGETVVSSSSTQAAAATTNNHDALPALLRDNDDNDDDEAPRPTANGGFTHTKTSKAKISAANKGKVPWNKGRQRSEEVKARIAAGVIARNRQRFLEKLRQKGLTEEEYNAQQEEKRRKREMDKQARRTTLGGYRPTEETKRKISHILKEKYAAGQVSRRPVDPKKVRRGFTHSDETRRKISESLRQRWATDPEYRAKMVQASNTINTQASVRQKISASLRAKWQDPTFRAQMMEKMASKRTSSSSRNKSSTARQKISDAIKAKWQDAEYREKILLGMNKRNAATPPKKPTVTSPRSGRKKVASKTRSASAPAVRLESLGTVRSSTAITSAASSVAAAPLLSHGDATVRAVQPLAQPRRRTAATPVKNRAPSKTTSSTRNNNNKSAGSAKQGLLPLAHEDDDHYHDPSVRNIIDDSLVDFATKSPKSPATRRSSKNKNINKTSSGANIAESASANGNVDLLKEERRDLYDFLYGDEDEEPLSGDSVDVNEYHIGSNDPVEYLMPLRRGGRNNKLASVFALKEDDDNDDDNLDNFDPYGLDGL